MMTKLEQISFEAEFELEVAMHKFPPFRSAHEGYAIILEELDELKKEILVKQSDRDLFLMRKEAVQLAAMCLRFVHDICNEEKFNA